MGDSDTSGPAWEPHFPFDIDKAKVKLFDELKDKFDAWLKAEPVNEPLGLTTGWHTITPEKAEQLLRRNRPGANRKSSLATIQYYAHQMRSGHWPETGQPLIFDENGVLVDGQHRLWACLFSNTPFTTFVVTGVKAIPHLFAYIDNSRARSPAAALQTAGYNGVSPTIAAIVKIAEDVADGMYSASTAGHRLRMAPIDFLLLMDKYPNAKLAARLASSDHNDAVKMTGHKDVVGYMIMAIMDSYGQEEADNFFYELADLTTESENDSAIMRLRKLIQEDQKKQSPMKRHQMLGNMIKAFNGWHAGTPLKSRWFMGSHEAFPTLAEAEQPLDDAAE
jgi:hypothetical protein